MIPFTCEAWYGSYHPNVALYLNMTLEDSCVVYTISGENWGDLVDIVGLKMHDFGWRKNAFEQITGAIRYMYNRVSAKLGFLTSPRVTETSA